MQELPRDRLGTTEMLFCEIRFEIGDCMLQLTAMEHQPGEGASMAERTAEEERTILPDAPGHPASPRDGERVDQAWAKVDQVYHDTPI